MLGFIYWLAALALSAAVPSAPHPSNGWQWAAAIVRALLFSPVYWIVLAALVAVLWVYADARTPGGKWRLGIAHGIVHMSALVALVSLLPPINAWLSSRAGADQWLPGWFHPGTLSYFFLFAGEMILVGGLAAGFIWGVYLWLTCAIAGIHDNDAFSAMRLGWYRHFLRLRIKSEELTIFPIGIDRAPRRSSWRWNPKRAKGDQNQPEVIPMQPLEPHLIEGPVVIVAPKAKAKTKTVTYCGRCNGLGSVRPNDPAQDLAALTTNTLREFVAFLGDCGGFSIW